MQDNAKNVVFKNLRIHNVNVAVITKSITILICSKVYICDVSKYPRS